MPVPVSPVVEVLQEYEIVFGKGQPQYQELPALVSSDSQRLVTARWELSDTDRKLIAEGADVFVTILSPGNLAPSRVTIGFKNMDENEANALFGPFTISTGGFNRVSG